MERDLISLEILFSEDEMFRTKREITLRKKTVEFYVQLPTYFHLKQRRKVAFVQRPFLLRNTA